MMKEELFKTLIKQLMDLNEIHYEYTENDNSYVLDSEKNGDTLTIKVKVSENKDKKEFEHFVDTLDDDLFNEVWESLSEEDELHTLNEIYDSPNYKEVINKFKAKVKEVVSQRIEDYKKLLLC